MLTLKRFCFILSMFLFISCLHGQNYQNICSPGITFFVDSWRNIEAFRQDSAIGRPGNDSVFVSFYSFHQGSGTNCYDTSNGTILGKRILKKDNGWFLFCNRNWDTLFINTQGTTGQSWKFCNLPANGSLRATVTGVSLDSVLGTTDSVKTIGFQAYDSSGNPLSHLFNSVVFKLGKVTGFTQITDFYSTPFSSTIFTLLGKTSTALGYQGLTSAMIYNFDTGDVFHYTYNWTRDLMEHYYTDEYIIYTVIGKTIGPTWVTYTYYECSKSTSGRDNWPPTISYSHDTLTESFYFNGHDSGTIFKSLPREFYVLENSPNLGCRFIQNYHYFMNRTIKEIDCWYYTSSGHCWSVNSASSYNQRYTEGLGCTFEEFSSMGESWQNSLTYYKKGNETWGNPTYADCGSMLPYLHVQKDTMYLDSTANSSDTLRITSNQDWIINTTQLPSWVSCSLSTGSGNAVVVFTSTIANTSVQRIASVRLSLSDGSNSILITVIQKEHVLSVENKSTPALILRPNPVRSDAEVYITGIPRGEKLSMVLTDLTGRIVFSDTFCHQPYIFHRGNLISGIYFLRILDEGNDPPHLIRVVIW